MTPTCHFNNYVRNISLRINFVLEAQENDQNLGIYKQRQSYTYLQRTFRVSYNISPKSESFCVMQFYERQEKWVCMQLLMLEPKWTVQIDELWTGRNTPSRV